jgi:hypothetical protein
MRTAIERLSSKTGKSVMVRGAWPQPAAPSNCPTGQNTPRGLSRDFVAAALAGASAAPEFTCAQILISFNVLRVQVLLRENSPTGITRAKCAAGNVKSCLLVIAVHVH